MAGYSGTPLAKKLGIKDGFRVAFVTAPGHARARAPTVAGSPLFAPTPKRVETGSNCTYAIVAGV